MANNLGVTTGSDATVKTLNTAATLHVPCHIGGTQDVICRTTSIADSDGAQTDLNLLAATVASGTQVVITQLWVKADKDNTTNVAATIGFGAANVPAASAAGTSGLIVDEDVGPGEGHHFGNGSGIIAVGASDEELRMTCGDPVGGRFTVGVTYFLMTPA